MAAPTRFRCNHCGGEMLKKRVAKHGGCLQLAGLLMFLPGLAAIGLALLIMFSVISTPAPAAKGAADGHAVAAGIFGLGSFGLLLVGAPSLAIGLFLNSARKVWKCSNCGSFVERL